MKKISIFLIALCLLATSAHAAPSLREVFDVNVSKVSQLNSSPKSIQYTFLIKSNKQFNGKLGIMLLCEGYENSASNTLVMSKYTKAYFLENFTNTYKFKIINSIGKRAIDYICCVLLDNKGNIVDTFIAKLNFGRTHGDILADIQDGLSVDVMMDIHSVKNVNKISKEYKMDHPISGTALHN